MEPDGGFRHEALFYEGTAGFLAGVSSFVCAGLAADEAVLVAVIEERAGPLRETLGADAARVEFLDMALVGRNPARIIPAWLDWAEANTARGRAFRGVGEPIWAGRTALEIQECLTHEQLLDTAFAAGPSWSLLCPYASADLPRPVLERALRSHSTTEETSATGAVFGSPPPRLGPPLYEAAFGVDQLPMLRQAVRERADALGLADRRRLADFVLVVDELASNSVRHGGGGGAIALWHTDRHAVCEVRDGGVITDPLVGRRRPDPQSRVGGAGLWTANQLCDLLLIHSTPETGTVVRAYLPCA